MMNQTKKLAPRFSPVRNNQKLAYAWCFEGVTYQ